MPYLTLGLLFLATSLFQPSQAADKIEALKSFIQNPGPIEELVFKVSSLQGQLETNATYIQLRRQEGAFFLREFQSLALKGELKAVPYGVLAGYYRDEYWAFSGEESLAVYHGASTIQQIGKFKNDVLAAIQRAENLAAKALNMGVADIPIGTIIWDGNSFVQQSPISKFNVRGELRIAAGGNPQMLVTYSKGDESYDYEAVYGYTREVIPGLPNELVITCLNGTSQTYPVKIELIEFRRLSAELPRSYFVPDQFIIPQITTTFQYTNGTVLYPNQGKLEEVRTTIPQLPDANGMPTWIFVALGLITFPLIYAVANMKRKG